MMFGRVLRMPCEFINDFHQTALALAVIRSGAFLVVVYKRRFVY
jgi:hypothetical protein